MKLFSIFFALCALGNAQSSRHFCALTLSVALADGSPVSSAKTELLDPNGTIVQRALIRGGYAEFCDFGFGDHSIRVYDEQHLPVTVTGIRLRYGHEQAIKVVLNSPVDVGSDMAIGNVCRAYARVTSIDGKPIASARAVVKAETYHADAFGRILLLVPLKQFASFRFEALGFDTRDVVFSCSGPEERIERSVILVGKASRE